MLARKLALASLAVAALAQPASAGVVWNESSDPDLSNDRLNPTALTLTLGSNTISGSVTSGERDYFRFNVPVGASLSQIVLAAYGVNNLSFFAIQSGTQITVDPAAPSAAPLLGYVHPALSMVGTNILDDMGNGAGSITFSGPLGPGDYSFWMQQTNPLLTSYTFDVILVPEPSVASLLALGLAALALARRHRS